MRNEFQSIADFYDSWTGGNEKMMVNNFTIRRMSLMWKIIISIVANNKIEHVLNLGEAFVRKTYKVDKKFIDELIDFQRKSVIDYHTLKNYPVTGTYNYDFYNYLLHNTKVFTAFPVNIFQILCFGKIYITIILECYMNWCFKFSIVQ